MTGQPLVLNPTARLLWRTPATVQLELGTRAVVLGGVDDAAVRALLGLQPDPVHVDAGDDSPAAAVLDVLHSSGFLVSLTDEAPIEPSGNAASLDAPVTPTAVPRLAGDLAALTLRHGSAASRVLAGRRNAAVAIVGTGRLAAMTAALIAAAGVGTVAVPGGAGSGRRGDVRVADAAPGGYLVGDEGRRAAEALADVVHRAAPEARCGPVEHPDLTVVVGDDPLADPADGDLLEALAAAGAAHLSVRAGGDLGIVGPLVLPGLTSCLRCADLHRCERDPSWSALAVQLSVPRRGSPPADVALCACVAGTAALQVLAWLDGEDPATVNGTLELRLPGWRIRRRSWPPHTGCSCGAGTSAAAQDGAHRPPSTTVAADSAQWPA